MKFNICEAVKATEGIKYLSDGPEGFNNVVIDSRSSVEDGAFFAIVGEVHDAHNFLEQAVENGIRTLFVSNEEFADSISKYCKAKSVGVNVILVKDTIIAMSNLAEYHLNKINPKKIAITGSMGKTTTRDMVYAVCSSRYKTGKPIKNYNSQIGVSMTVLAYDLDVQVAVVEIGMERLHEIHEIVEWVKPDISVITYIGLTHLEQLGSAENIYKAKMEITDFLDKDDLLIINEDSPHLNKNTIVGQYDIISIGSDPSKESDYFIGEYHDFGQKGIDFIFKSNFAIDGLTEKQDFENFESKIELPIPGAHNRYNAALAMAVGVELGISIEDSLEAIRNIQITVMRMEFKDNGYIRVMDDSYSSFPEAVKSAIDSIMSTEARRHVAILAGMNGWAHISRKVHCEIGEYAVEKGMDVIICVGQHTDDIASAAFRMKQKKGSKTEIMFFSEKAVLLRILRNLIQQDDLVLVKGSRMYAMEEVVKSLLEIIS
ncbi:UDP-N-acetylmuramoyl-tripeptide--D-alanyl-D-alanine ligase [Eubacteriales bacterium KG127]